MIQFDCPKCKQSLEVDDAGAGLKVPCPTCAAPIAIPQKVEIRIRRPQSPLTPPSPVATDATESEKSSVKTTASTAGWLCYRIFALGAAGGALLLLINPSLWWVLFGAMTFCSVAVICAIVAMCTAQIESGLKLLIVSLVTIAVTYGFYNWEMRRNVVRQLQEITGQSQQQIDQLIRQITPHR